MRAFIAIDFPEEINDYLLHIQHSFKDVKGLSLAKQFHLTLKFLGEISKERADEVERALMGIKFNFFKSCFTNIGCFPNENYIRVIWVGIEENPVAGLNSMIEGELLKTGFKREAFSPHITLARVRFLTDKISFVKKLKEISIEKREFWIREFHLKKSTLTPKGPIYETLATFKLG